MIAVCDVVCFPRVCLAVHARERAWYSRLLSAHHKQGYTDTSWDNDQRQRYVQGGDRSLGGGGDVGLGGWNVGAHGPDFSGDISSVRGGGDTPPDSPRQHEGLGTSMTTAQASPAERRPLDESIDELRSSFVASFEVELEVRLVGCAVVRCV